MEKLKEISNEFKMNMNSKEYAELMDKNDKLNKYRNEFNIPPNPYNNNNNNKKRKYNQINNNNNNNNNSNNDNKESSLYMCGNSLGLLPKRTVKLLNEELDKWSNIGVEGHFKGARPWAHIDEYVVPLMSKLVGAKSSEVAIMNSLSVNLHLLLISFYRPTPKKYKILIEAHAFCSDHHVVKSQIQLHGYDIDDALICLKPRENEYYLRTEDILQCIRDNGNELALVMLPGVQFYTGHAFDMKTITSVAREYNCNVGFDLAHAVGNIPLKLNEWDIDFAAWCTYKYLNSGPGAIGGIFLHEKHENKTNQELKRLCGWWGQKPTTRFAMKSEWEMLPGAQSYQLSNPAVLPTICLLGSLQIFDEAGFDNLREKSLKLTAYLEYLLLENVDTTITIITPTNPQRRGCQLSLLTNVPVRPIHSELEKLGIICDVREPNVMRIAPTPLYNTFVDVYEFVQRLSSVIQSLK